MIRPGAGGPPLLRTEGLAAGYGEALVLQDVSLAVHAGEVVSVVGPSGAGKTTLFRALVGLIPCRSGSVWFAGRRIDGLPPYRVAALGLVAMPEGRRLFSQLTVRENLLVGAYLPEARRRRAESLATVERLFPALARRRNLRVDVLSAGEQQMVALARSLMARPRLLLLDDPFIGLARPLVPEVARAVRELPGQGTAVLATGQHVRRLLRLADRAYLLQGGRVTAEGPGLALLEHPEVRAALLDEPRRAAGA